MSELSELLDNLKEEWRRQQIPIADLIAPGLSSAVVDALLAPVGIDLPDEAREWWLWHNGVPGATRQQERRRMAGDHGCLSVPEAIQYRQMMLDVVRKTGSQGPPGLMQSHWLPIVDTFGSPVAVCDTSVPKEAPVPVYLLDWGGNEEGHLVPAARSIAEMVRGWLEAFRAGAYQYLPAEERWYIDFDVIMSQFRGRRLI